MVKLPDFAGEQRGLWRKLETPLAPKFGAALAVGIAYFLLAKFGLKLASLNPSASPVWPPTGFALAMVMLLGNRVWPGIFFGALIANATTAGSLATSFAAAVGNTAEAVLGAYLIARWCGGTHAFESPERVAKFALVTIGPATLISATTGVVSLWLSGFVDLAQISSVWTTWWMGDFASALLLTPAIVLWADRGGWPLSREDVFEALLLLLATCVIGLIVFSPLRTLAFANAPVGFLAVVPLLWAGVRRGPRDTASVGLLLATIAIWCAATGNAPFTDPAGHDRSFLLVTMFVVCAALPSLALSAEVALRRRAEALLRIHQQDLDRAQSVSHTGSWRLDVNRNELSWSPENHRIFGLPAGTPMTYETFLGIVHPDDRAYVDREWTAAVKGAPYDIEHRIVVDGAVKWVRERATLEYDGTGKLVGGFGTTQDITDKKNAAQALADSEARFRAITDQAADAIFVTDRHGRVTFANPEAEQIFGFTVNEMIGSYLHKLFHHHNQPHPDTDCALTRFQLGAPAVRNHEDIFFRKDGTPVDVLCSNAQLDLDGKPCGAVLIVHNISARKKGEQELRESREQLALDLNAMARLQKIGTLFVREGNLEPVLVEIVDAAIAISGADFGNIQLREPDSGQLRIAAQRGLPRQWIEFWDSVSKGQGTCGTALERGERVIVEDVGLSPIFIGTPSLDIQLKAGIRAVQSTPLMSRSGQPLGMISTHYRMPCRPNSRTLALLDLLARQAADIVERAQAEAALRKSEERFSLSMEATNDGLWDWNVDTDEVYCSPSYYRALGYSPGEFPIWTQLLHPDDKERTLKANADCVEGRAEGFAIEYRMKARTGEWRWMLARAKVIDRNRQGRATRLVGSNVDITERKRREEQVQLLLKEVNHRAKNLLGVVQAIAWQTAAADRDEFIERFSERIQALAANQDLLVRSEWKGVELGELVRLQLVHFEDLIGRRITLNGPALRINSETAQSMGMALHELATNAGKYGALSNREGEVKIVWAINRAGAGEPRFEMSWSECGGPEVQPPTRRGFGTIVTEQMPRTQLGADVVFDYATSGISWRMSCPLGRILENSDVQLSTVEDAVI